MMAHFILASSSPRRRALLHEHFGVDAVVIKPDIEEVRGANEHPFAYVQRLSAEKARAVLARLTPEQKTDGTLILAADTTVVLATNPETIGIDNDEAVEKPATPDQARAMLRKLRGRDHIVATSVTLMRIDGGKAGKSLSSLVQSTVHMRDYSDSEIDAYIATGEPFDKAGGYAIQDTTGFNPVARYAGSYTGIMGLPVETVMVMLREINGVQA
jgi:MAF protein